MNDQNKLLNTFIDKQMGNTQKQCIFTLRLAYSMPIAFQLVENWEESFLTNITNA